MNPIKVKYIEQRIDELFPLENFFFFKILKGESEEIKERNKIEQEELLKLIDESINGDRYFIKSGLLEPIHLTEEERDLLVDGMLTSTIKIAEEVIKSKEICMNVNSFISEELAARIEETVEFQKNFSSLLRDKPYILQKGSLHGLILAKEILSKARDEANNQS